MVKGRYFRLGAGLIVVGAALIALNVWFLATGHTVPGSGRGNGALIAIGGTMLIAGVMVLLGC
jgi:predicted phage tail protein